MTDAAIVRDIWIVHRSVAKHWAAQRAPFGVYNASVLIARRAHIDALTDVCTWIVNTPLPASRQAKAAARSLLAALDEIAMHRNAIEKRLNAA